MTLGHLSKPSISESNSTRGTTPPVGFAGLLRIINRVFSFIFDNTSSAQKAKPFSSLKGIGTGIAPENLIVDSYIGKPGLG